MIELNLFAGQEDACGGQVEFGGVAAKGETAGNIHFSISWFVDATWNPYGLSSMERFADTSEVTVPANASVLTSGSSVCVMFVTRFCCLFADFPSRSWRKCRWMSPYWPGFRLPVAFGCMSRRPKACLFPHCNKYYKDCVGFFLKYALQGFSART